MGVKIVCKYTCYSETEVDIPWKKVKDWYVRWCTLHYTLDGKIWLEAELDEPEADTDDLKHPESVRIGDNLFTEMPC